MAHTTLHEHGDGTYHTDTHNGKIKQHATIGSALMHLAKLHGEEGSAHMHIEQPEEGPEYVTNHVDGGAVAGPHSHANIEALKKHVAKVLPGAAGAEMSKFLNEEENED